MRSRLKKALRLVHLDFLKLQDTSDFYFFTFIHFARPLHVIVLKSKVEIITSNFQRD
jgi:hypothetical protein